jgi:exopolyphosphatase/guanosine-5'-triphosphate,3'-diphosphate pyrophosphatase
VSVAIGRRAAGEPGHGTSPALVAVLDIGSNTARLLVAADARHGGVSPVREERVHLGLGAEIEREGDIGAAKLAETARSVAELARLARVCGAARTEAIVTAPGRQAGNARDLLDVIARASGCRPRVLSPDEEGRLAYAGALAMAGTLPRSVAVCDVGGGSTELVVGERGHAPSFVCSVDVGSLRLTSRCLPSDPPRKSEIRAARQEVAARFAGVVAPHPKAALATGGSARALRRLVGRALGHEQLERALRETTERSSAKLARRHGIDPERARTLAAGAVILLEAQSRLGTGFEVARGGLREGVAEQMLRDLPGA